MIRYYFHKKTTTFSDTHINIHACIFLSPSRHPEMRLYNKIPAFRMKRASSIKKDTLCSSLSPLCWSAQGNFELCSSSLYFCPVFMLMKSVCMCVCLYQWENSLPHLIRFLHVLIGKGIVWVFLIPVLKEYFFIKYCLLFKRKLKNNNL